MIYYSRYYIILRVGRKDRKHFNGALKVGKPYQFKVFKTSGGWVKGP